MELTDKHRVKRVYIQSIDDYSCQSLTPIFEEHISEKASIITDKWNGYIPLKEKYNITQIESNKGKNFNKLHIVVHQIKSWLRTIMVHVSKKHITNYFNEFCYRINRSQNKASIFHNTILQMINHKPITIKEIQNVNL